MLKVLDLFSGIGGFSLGLERTGGFETVAFCEIEPFCRRVLAKHWPGVKCYPDVRELSAQHLTADGIVPDVICGGFPCQDISIAQRDNWKGLAGERSGLWREYARLIGEIRPAYILVENVPALLGRGLGDVLGDMAAIGYDAEWHCIRAARFGLPQPRDRVWIIAYRDSERLQRRLSERTLLGTEAFPLAEIRDEIPTSFVTHGHDGLPRRVVRTQHPSKALGNSIAPDIAAYLGRAILAAEAA